MKISHRAFAIGGVLGLAMSVVVWLVVDPASPAYRLLTADPGAGYALMIVNLPALAVSRLVSGTPPAPAIVYASCFVQWFVVGAAIAWLAWRGLADRERSLS